MSVFVKVIQELATVDQIAQVSNSELGGMQLKLIEASKGDVLNSFIIYLTSTEAKALARMLNEVSDK
jgi:hypothetical protein